MPKITNRTNEKKLQSDLIDEIFENDVDKFKKELIIYMMKCKSQLIRPQRLKMKRQKRLMKFN